jgi:lamin B
MFDREIAAYRKVLESEEARLNISPTESSYPEVKDDVLGSQMPVRVSKRKRVSVKESEESEELSDHYLITSHAKGDIEISETCTDGNYVRLHNKGQKVS